MKKPENSTCDHKLFMNVSMLQILWQQCSYVQMLLIHSTELEEEEDVNQKLSSTYRMKMKWNNRHVINGPEITRPRTKDMEKERERHAHL